MLERSLTFSLYKTRRVVLRTCPKRGGWEEPGPGTTQTWVPILSCSYDWLGNTAQAGFFPLALGYRAVMGMK